MLPVEFRSAATSDAEQARTYLDEQQFGLGDRFIGLLVLTVDRIGTFPESGTEVLPGIRCALTPVFHYRVLYKIETDRVVILAVRHPLREFPAQDDL